MKKTLLLIISLLTFAIISSGCANPNAEKLVNAVEDSSDTKFSMKYDEFTGTKSHEINVKNKFTYIDMDIVTDSGTIDVKIVSDDSTEKVIYEAEDVNTCVISVTMQEAGWYNIIVTGKNHKGSFSFDNEF